MIRIFIGHDHVEEISYHALCSSIIRRSSEPVSITPIKTSHFRKFFSRERLPDQSNEFTLSRFLVPYLCDYQGWAIFMDCDMIVNCDIAELWAMRDYNYWAMVCKHDYTPKDKVKYLGNVQSAYPCKNWSSMMLINCDRAKMLTPAIVESAEPSWLHQFKWAPHVGSLSLDYNWLVGEYDYNENAKIVHYTVGGPWFEEYRGCDYAELWFEELKYAAYAEPSRKASDLLQRAV